MNAIERLTGCFLADGEASLPLAKMMAVMIRPIAEQVRCLQGTWL